MQIDAMIRKSVAELVGTFASFFAGISAIINVGSTSGVAGLFYSYLFLPKPAAASGQ